MNTTPLTADDRVEITELFGHYAWAADTGDLDGYVATFTDDGVFDGIMGYYDGPDRLRQLAAQVHAGPRSRGIQHWVNNSVFKGNHDRCVVRSMAFAPRRIENEHTIVFVGYYIDTCRRVDGSWLFEIRRFRPWVGEVLDGGRPWETGADDGGWITRPAEAVENPNDTERSEQSARLESD
jgi:hypothetical protein